MRPIVFAAFVIVQFTLSAYVGEAFAWSSSPGGAVTYRTNTTLVQGRGDEWLPLDKELTLTREITVFTNAQFQFKEGKQRKLSDGQILRADGFLLNPDGTTEPVCDHLLMKDGSVTMVRDGEAQQLAGSFTLPDSTVVERDGWYVRPGGRRARMVDGQMVTLEGEPLQGLDTVSLRGGRVVVYKSGGLLSLDATNKILGMFDGSRVTAQGLVTSNDGSSIQLEEGQTITAPGVRASF